MSEYPFPSLLGTIEMMLLTLIPVPGSDPSKGASPKAKTPPSGPVSQYPSPRGVEVGYVSEGIDVTV
jgi:hypothetical protein